MLCCVKKQKKGWGFKGTALNVCVFLTHRPSHNPSPGTDGLTSIQTKDMKKINAVSQAKPHVQTVCTDINYLLLHKLFTKTKQEDTSTDMATSPSTSLSSISCWTLHYLPWLQAQVRPLLSSCLRSAPGQMLQRQRGPLFLQEKSSWLLEPCPPPPPTHTHTHTHTLPCLCRCHKMRSVKLPHLEDLITARPPL